MHVLSIESNLRPRNETVQTRNKYRFLHLSTVIPIHTGKRCRLTCACWLCNNFYSSFYSKKHCMSIILIKHKLNQIFKLEKLKLYGNFFSQLYVCLSYKTVVTHVLQHRIQFDNYCISSVRVNSYWSTFVIWNYLSGQVFFRVVTLLPTPNFYLCQKQIGHCLHEKNSMNMIALNFS